MRHAGCYLMHWGIESGSQRVLDGVKKKLKVSEATQTLQLAKECGIENHAYFMLGLLWLENGEIKGEEKEDVFATIDLAIKLRRKGFLDTIQFSILTPFPGSPIWEHLRDKGMLLDSNDPMVPLHEVTFRHPNLSANQIRRLHKKAYIKFIMDWKFILNKARMLREPGGLINFLKQARVVFSMIFGFSPR